MEEFHAPLHKYLAVVVVLFVYACHEVVLTHGRQIKAKNQHSSLHIDNINGNFPTSTHKIVHSLTIPNRHVAAASFGASNAENTNAFRPTTPGNSPGVGHRKFGGDNDDIKAKVAVQSPDVERYSVTSEGSKTDFKPTEPGHSPGVGHAAHQNNKN